MAVCDDGHIEGRSLIAALALVATSRALKIYRNACALERHERSVFSSVSRSQTVFPTATDALQRSWINYNNGEASGNGAGLRAGTFATNFGDGTVWTPTLTNCAFSKDATVNGTVTWVYNGKFEAELAVSGSGTAGGTLHIEGTSQAPGPVSNFEVSGTLGRKQVGVLVPEA